MLKRFVFLSLLALVGTGVTVTPTSADAQLNDLVRKGKRTAKKALGKKTRKKKKTKKVTKAKPRKKAAPPASAWSDQKCKSLKGVISNRNRRLRSMTGDKAGYDSEYRDLQARIKELEGLRSSLDKQIKALRAKQNRSRTAYKSNCGKAQTCKKKEAEVAQLEKDAKPIEDDLKRLRKELKKTKREIGDLEKKIPPVKAEYNRLKCRNLVPGETSQRTIDRCSDLFSKWNSLQARLNKLNKRLPGIRATFARRLRQLDALKTPMDEHNEYLAKNCKKSRKKGRLKKMRKRHSDFRTLGRDIDRAIDRVKKLKGIKFTVEVN